MGVAMASQTPQNRWRDRVFDPLPVDSIGFYLLSNPNGGACWYVEAGPLDLLTLRARERVINAAGVATRTVRFHVIPPDPDYGGLGKLGLDGNP